ncbi:sulfur carrier protein ThiS adenylyltransferase [Pseudobutyrivibrio ruminis]|uniref:Sulfur carrier protein ThiS adenylyltransferase n=1 Tax=Pseudobutyrivibrio ruminis TaxID=46206 RepID=A0A1H7JX45_9FIRM|nr:sulfur carrier protein ThiS adenylyltransferase ThiF [Pseudobutyrivibrio ruminis]SEK79163.1 sulfur carrier protein ThiS adenylyltransferase [Pseudobutyrivibrio ruminis]
MIPTKEEFYQALVERHGADNQKKFDEAVVAICGLGGLGSNIATCLARAGVGHLILIDFDSVDVSNLHRQQYKINQVGMAKTDALKANLEEINPFIKIETHQVKMTEANSKSLIEKASIVCEAFDSAQNKAMLVNLVLEQMPEKYILSSSGMAGFNSANDISTRKVSKKFYMSGDGVSDVNDGIGLISSRVMVCGAHEAHMVIRILIGELDA